MQFHYLKYFKYKKYEIAYSKFIKDFRKKHPIFEHETNCLEVFHDFIVNDLIYVSVYKKYKKNFNLKNFIKLIHQNEQFIKDFYGYDIFEFSFWLAKEIYSKVLKYME